MSIDQAKLQQWFEDWQTDTPFPEVTDDDLTKEEVKWLEARVLELVIERTRINLDGEDRMVMPPAKGLQ